MKKHQKVLIKLHFLPNLNGNTPLHLCIKNAYSKATENILLEIGKYPIDDHSRFIKDTFANLINICPTALGEYFDMRIIKPSWALS